MIIFCKFHQILRWSCWKVPKKFYLLQSHKFHLRFFYIAMARKKNEYTIKVRKCDFLHFSAQQQHRETSRPTLLHIMFWNQHSWKQNILLYCGTLCTYSTYKLNIWVYKILFIYWSFRVNSTNFSELSSMTTSELSGLRQCAPRCAFFCECMIFPRFWMAVNSVLLKIET